LVVEALEAIGEAWRLRAGVAVRFVVEAWRSRIGVAVRFVDGA